ncbi:MAG: hypothetical protein DCC57_23210, partial [Chloroflexi bacterium]
MNQSRISRRDFLRGSAITAATVFAAACAPAAQPAAQTSAEG